MKVIKTVETVKIPKVVTVKVNARVVTVKGPRGTLKKSFRHFVVDFRRVGKYRLNIEKWFGVKKEVAAVRSVSSEINNMIKGVIMGYRYKMKTVYAHFPINTVLGDKGSSIEVRNFLGEKYTRHVDMLPGVTVANTGQKDEIQIDGNDLELVSRTAALIHQSTKVPEKDIRQFLDGVYVSEKGSIGKPTNWKDHLAAIKKAKKAKK